MIGKHGARGTLNVIAPSKIGLLRATPNFSHCICILCIFNVYQVPDLCEDLLSSVDQPLKIARDKTVGKDYLLCDYNRDGDSYRLVFNNNNNNSRLLHSMKSNHFLANQNATTVKKAVLYKVL